MPYRDAVEEAICFGWIDGKMRSVDADRYALRFKPRKPGSAWSKANREKAEELMQAGKVARAGLARIEEAGKNGRWEAAYAVKERPVLLKENR